MRIADRLKPLTSPELRRSVLLSRMWVRRRMPGLRQLPDFLVIGAQRCGTSSLYKYLSYHPLISASLRKEIGYFSRYYGHDVDWYRLHFPLERHVSLARGRGGPRPMSFEATPDYLLHPLAAERARQLVPDAKLIVLLREPVARAISHYHHMVRLGFEHLSFDEAIRREDDRLACDLAAIPEDPHYDPKSFLRFSYRSRGLYAEQLERWMAHYPRERLLIIDSEDLFQSPAATYTRILEFLDLAPLLPQSFPNVSEHPRGAGSAEVSSEARRRLADAFIGPNADLVQLLGHDLSWTGS